MADRLASRFLLAAALLAAACQGPERLAGGASETEATVAGRIANADGSPAADVLVRLRPADYLQDTSRLLAKGSLRLLDDTRTDARGAFRFDSVYLGDYALEAAAGRTGAIRRASVNGSSDNLDLGTTAMGATSNVQGRIVLPAGTTGGAYVMVYGLEKGVRTDSSGVFLIPQVPAGQFSLKMIAASPTVAEKEVIGVTVVPDAPAYLGDLEMAHAPGSEKHEAWGDSARILVDTRNIQDTGLAIGYPLLLRLDRSNFDFTQSTGLDLRFANAAGKGLAYEVESWDPLAGKASVWVRADTLRPGDSAQFLKMYWNKPGAPGQSASASVFDTADGYAGAWHLQRETAATGETRFPDASGEGNPAIGTGLDHAGFADGISDQGLELNGKDQAVSATRAYFNPNVFSLSLWFRAQAGASGKLAGFGSQRTGPSVHNDRHIWLDNAGILHFGVFVPSGGQSVPGTRKILSSAAAYTDGAWHQVTARLSPQGQFLFVDGRELASDPGTTRGSNYAGFWRFGYDYMALDYSPADLWFRGTLDEPRVSLSPWNAFRIRLDYETQKPGSTLVRIAP